MTYTDWLDNLRLFSGSAHPQLARAIAADLGIDVSPINIKKFSNDNFEIQFGVSVRGKDVFLLQPLVPPTSDHLLELLLMLDIARTSGARSIHAVIPHYSYGRSDKKDAPRISIAARLVADLLVEAGAQHVIAMTLHSPQVHGFFSVPTDHLTPHPVLIDYFGRYDLSRAVVVSPDLGHAKRAGKLAHSLGLPLAVGHKIRLSDETVNIGSVLGDVRGKRVIISEDEIATGGTIAELVRVLNNEGAGPIIVTCTHGLFRRNAAERLNALPNVEAIVTTDTVPLTEQQKPDKLVVLSVAHIFAEVIRRTLVGQSVGELFEFWPDS